MTKVLTKEQYEPMDIISIIDDILIATRSINTGLYKAEIIYEMTREKGIILKMSEKQTIG